MPIKKIRLAKLPTRAPENANKNRIEAKTKELTSKIRELVTLMYANKKNSLLVVLQGLSLIHI